MVGIFLRIFKEISTHILTRRMTLIRSFDICHFFISTHILTRRMTDISETRCSPVTFQLTSSQGGWPIFQLFHDLFGYFNSHPHKEDDINMPQFQKAGAYFNSHPHKEDDILQVPVLLSHRIFQLTSSQGGWRLLFFSLFFLANFNSHPHKEDDHPM